MLPWGAGAAGRRVWRVADVIWEAAGDTATDYNRQTKRGLLSAVILGIVLRWLAGLEGEALDALIMKRLKQVMKLGQTGSKVLKPLLDGLAGMRAK
jgi:ubiquinone biosynthesis protein COQ9